MLMARWTNMNWRDSFSLGVLMNTRGLVELVVLNIGYDLEFCLRGFCDDGHHGPGYHVYDGAAALALVMASHYSSDLLRTAGRPARN